jgi:hypothetical protein
VRIAERAEEARPPLPTRSIRSSNSRLYQPNLSNARDVSLSSSSQRLLRAMVLALPA